MNLFLSILLAVGLLAAPVAEPEAPREGTVALTNARIVTVTNGVIDASIGEDAFFKGWLIYGTNLPQTIPGVEQKLRDAADSLELVVVVETMPSEVTGTATGPDACPSSRIRRYWLSMIHSTNQPTRKPIPIVSMDKRAMAFSVVTSPISAASRMRLAIS